jgi:hypothetical protein
MAESATEPPSPTLQRTLGRTVLVPQEQTAPRAGLRWEFKPPRPLLTAALLPAAVAAVTALWLVDLLPVLAALVIGAVLSPLVLLRACLSCYELHRCRRLGDALLRAYPQRPPVSSLAAWRSTELTSVRSRRRLTGFVGQLRREIDACTGSNAPPEESALAQSSNLLRRLEDRLTDATQPVSSLGMLELRALVSDEFSPLYFPERAGDLPTALAQALTTLEHARASVSETDAVSPANSAPPRGKPCFGGHS